MVYVSNLPNDRDMIRALGTMAVPFPSQEAAIGDACFTGLGDSGQPIFVVCERKKIGDIAQCINDSRYLHQLQIAHEAGADVFVLIVEGECRPNPDDGLLEVPVWGMNHRTMHRCQMWELVKPAMTYSRFDQYLTELDYLAGVMVKRSRDVRETAAIILALWTNFQLTPDRHNSLKRIFSAPQNGVVELVRPGLVRRVSKELDGIGWEKSRAVAEHFHTVRELVSADCKEWEKIPGVGKKIASRVVAALGGVCEARK